MQFAPFTCLLVFDSSLKSMPKATPKTRRRTAKKIMASSFKNFSITHFDENLDTTTLLSSSRFPQPSKGRKG